MQRRFRFGNVGRGPERLRANSGAWEVRAARAVLTMSLEPSSFWVVVSIGAGDFGGLGPSPQSSKQGPQFCPFNKPL
eukprot:11179700-Lingulodinium_polyedra.AAC.1